jgi:hypothetical protein
MTSAPLAWLWEVKVKVKRGWSTVASAAISQPEDQSPRRWCCTSTSTSVPLPLSDSSEQAVSPGDVGTLSHGTSRGAAPAETNDDAMPLKSEPAPSVAAAAGARSEGVIRGDGRVVSNLSPGSSCQRPPRIPPPHAIGLRGKQPTASQQHSSTVTTRSFG